MPLSDLNADDLITMVENLTAHLEACSMGLERIATALETQNSLIRSQQARS